MHVGRGALEARGVWIPLEQVLGASGAPCAGEDEREVVSPGWKPQSFGAKVSTGLALPCRPSSFILEALRLPNPPFLHSGLGSLADDAI